MKEPEMTIFQNKKNIFAMKIYSFLSQGKTSLEIKDFFKERKIDLPDEKIDEIIEKVKNGDIKVNESLVELEKRLQDLDAKKKESRELLEDYKNLDEKITSIGGKEDVRTKN